MSRARTPHLGFYLQTCDRPGSTARHRLAGPRSEHVDVTFPRCPSCDVKTSPIYRIDFDDPWLVALGIWRGVFVAMRCHNGCMTRAEPTWWDYTRPLAPTIETFDTSSSVSAFDDWEYEGDAIELEPRLAKPRDTYDQRSRVGGEACWLGRPDAAVIAELTGESARAEDDDNPRCIGCGNISALLVQWSEVGMTHIPSGRGRGGHVSQLLQPGISSWFGCMDCWSVALVEEPA